MSFATSRHIVILGLVILLASLTTSCATPIASQVPSTSQEAAPTSQPAPTQNPSPTKPSEAGSEANTGPNQTPPVSEEQPHSTAPAKTPQTNDQPAPTQNSTTTKPGVTVTEVNPGLDQTPPAWTVPGVNAVPSQTPATNQQTCNLPPTTGPTKAPEINIAELEMQIHSLINAERKKQGLSPLIWDAQLGIVARKHSEDMAQRNYFDHTTPEGYGPMDRCRQAGLAPRGCAENIFQCTLAKADWYKNGVLEFTEYYTQDDIAALVVNGWMNSPGHRQNILTAFWASEGIGVGISSDGKVYITEDFN